MECSSGVIHRQCKVRHNCPPSAAVYFFHPLRVYLAMLGVWENDWEVSPIPLSRRTKRIRRSARGRAPRTSTD